MPFESSSRARGATLTACAGREELAALALEMFGEIGFAKASPAVLATKAEIAVEHLLTVFPDGKDEFAAAAVEYADASFEETMIRALGKGEPREAISRMLHIIELYFQVAGRLRETPIVRPRIESRLVEQMRVHFRDWTSALTVALVRAGLDNTVARNLSVDVVGGFHREIQVSVTFRNSTVLVRALRRYRSRLDGVLRGRRGLRIGPQTHLMK